MATTVQLTQSAGQLLGATGETTGWDPNADHGILFNLMVAWAKNYGIITVLAIFGVLVGISILQTMLREKSLVHAADASHVLYVLARFLLIPVRYFVVFMLLGAAVLCVIGNSAG